MKKLQMAFSKKEKAERLLANLEDLKGKGEIEDDQYEAMKEEYSAVLDEGNSEIQAIKEELAKTLEAYRKDLEIYTQELKNLEVRIKVGELSADKYKRQEQKTRGKVEKLQQQADNLENLLKANSSADVGGFIDVPIKKGAKGKEKKGFWRR